MTAPSHVRCISIALKILTFIFLIERWVFGFDSLLLLRQVVVPLIGCHSCWAWATLTHFLEVGNMATSASASTLPGFSCDAAVKKGRIASQFSFSLDSSLVTLVHRLGYSKQDIKCTLFKLFAIEAVTGRRGSSGFDPTPLASWTDMSYVQPVKARAYSSYRKHGLWPFLGRTMFLPPCCVRRQAFHSSSNNKIQ